MYLKLMRHVELHYVLISQTMEGEHSYAEKTTRKHIYGSKVVCFRFDFYVPSVIFSLSDTETYFFNPGFLI